MYLLDTNVLSALVRARRPPRLEQRLATLANAPVYTSCICVMELRHGAARRDDGGALWHRIEDEILRRVEVLGVEAEDAIVAGDVMAHLNARGTPIDVEDVLIGATALRRALVVVTGNVRHFARIPGLVVEDWLAAEGTPPESG